MNRLLLLLSALGAVLLTTRIASAQSYQIDTSASNVSAQCLTYIFTSGSFNVVGRNKWTAKLTNLVLNGEKSATYTGTGQMTGIFTRMNGQIMLNNGIMVNGPVTFSSDYNTVQLNLKQRGNLFCPLRFMISASATAN